MGTIGSGANGSLGGLFSSARGVAVNLGTGDLYVADGANNRIQQFDADGNFIRAWGTDVIALGKPGDTGTGFEICEVEADCKAGTTTGGVAGQVAQPMGIAIDQTNGYIYATSNTNRRVDVFSAQGEFAGAFGWGVDTVGVSALELCTTGSSCQQGATGGPEAGRISGWVASDPSVDPSAPPGTVYVSDTGANLRVSKFATTISGGQLSSVSFLKAFGWDVAPAAVDEEQEIRVRATAGQFTLAFAGDTTADLPFNASAAEVQAALNALPSIAAGGGSVAVSGGSGNASGSNLYVVRFNGGPLAGTDAPALVAASGTVPLSGVPASNAAVTTRANGGTSTELESCTAASGCKAGVSGGGLGQFVSSASPTSSSVDSTGAIYVVSGPLQLATNSCAVGTPCRVYKFDRTTSSATIVGPDVTAGKVGEVAALDVAVDTGNDHVFVSRRSAPSSYRIEEYDSGGALVETHPAGSLPSATVTIGHGLEVGIEDRLYSSQTGNSIHMLGEVPKPPNPVVLPATDVTETSAVFHGEVTVATLGSTGFETTWHFEYSTNGSNWTAVPIPDVSLGAAPGTFPVDHAVDGLQPNTEYVVRLAASTSSGTARSDLLGFTTGATPPRIPLTYVEDVSQTAATLSAHVDPQGLKATYHFEWATEDEWNADPGEYSRRAPAFERQLGDGNQAIIAQESIAGLEPASRYHYRVVATNAVDSVEGPDQMFETLNDCGLTDDRCYELVSPADKGPVGSAGEVVVLGQELQFQADPQGGAIEYQMAYGTPDSTSGNEVVHRAVREPSGWASTQLAPPTLVTPGTPNTSTPSRTLGVSADLSCGIYNSSQPLVDGAPSKALDEGLGLLYKGDGTGDFTLLTESDPSVIGPQGGEYPAAPYRLIGVSEGPGADCERVVFRTALQYPDIPGEGVFRLYEWDNGTLRDVGVIPGPGGLVPAETVPGALQDPAKNPGDQGAAGYVPNSASAVSSDASRIVFTSVSKLGGDVNQQAVFLRDHAGGIGDLATASATVQNVDSTLGTFGAGQEISGAGIPSGTTILSVEETAGEVTGLTLSQPVAADATAVALTAIGSTDVSQSQTLTPNTGPSRFEYASRDTGEVLFTAGYGLADNSNPGGSNCTIVRAESSGLPNGPGCALYRYSVADGELTDLSVPEAGASSSGGAGVVGVLGASADGQVVYFAARGQLVEGAGPTEAENLSRQTFSVYRNDAGSGENTYVGVIHQQQARGALTAASGDGQWTSRVSPDGRYLLFSSKEDLTEYKSAGLPQAYLYDDQTRDLACVSCRRDQEPPAAVPSGFTGPLGRGGLDVENRRHPPLRLAVDGDGTARVYFSSYDALAAGGEDGSRNFYQWEDGQISYFGGSAIGGVDENRYAGASADGDDVYFTTFERLAWNDTDAKLDIYDVRVGGGFAKPPSPPAPCSPLVEGSCQAGPGSGPGPVSPASAALAGQGNPPDAGQRKKKTTKKKGKKGKKKGRKGKRRQSSWQQRSENQTGRAAR